MGSLTSAYAPAFSMYLYLPLISQDRRVQLADKQQAMNHWMFFPTTQC